MSPWNSALVVLLFLTVVACTNGGSVSVAESVPAASSTTSVTGTGASTTTETTATGVSTTAPQVTTTTAEDRGLGPELVFNGDFLVGDVIPTGWEFRAESPGQSVDYTAEAESAHISLSAPVEEGVAWPEARLLQGFTVTPHTDYQLAVMVRSPGQGRLFLALGFRDADGGDILVRGPGEPMITGSDWSLIESEIESPHAAASGYVILQLAIRPEVVAADSLSVDVGEVSVREVLGS